MRDLELLFLYGLVKVNYEQMYKFDERLLWDIEAIQINELKSDQQYLAYCDLVT